MHNLNAEDKCYVGNAFIDADIKNKYSDLICIYNLNHKVINYNNSSKVIIFTAYGIEQM